MIYEVIKYSGRDAPFLNENWLLIAGNGDVGQTVAYFHTRADAELVRELLALHEKEQNQ